jgi:hypothetical protein
MKLWKVEVAPCRAGDQVSTQQTTGISSSVPGHIVIRDGYQKVPSVGSAIWGTAVDDMGLTCSNAGSEYIGTVTGGLEIDENAAAGCDAAKNTTQAAAGSNGSDGTDWVKVGTTAVLAPIVVPTKVVIEGVEAVGNLFGGW